MSNDTLPLDDRCWELPNYNEDVYRQRDHRYALVIPVINEGGRIRKQLERIDGMNLPVDVIVADGGSMDDSLASEFIKSVGVTAVLTKTGPGRLSAQLRMAYSWCIEQNYDGIITIDGNGKDGVEAVNEMARRLDEGFDYVQGSIVILLKKRSTGPASLLS